MQNLKIETEVLLISLYANIILNILKKHNELSVCKILFFSYLIKEDKFRVRNVYSANNSQDVVYKAISLIAGKYNEYCENLEFIIKAIHLLVENKEILISNNRLCLYKEFDSGIIYYRESPFIANAIEESKKVTDRQFLKEVIANV